MNDEPVFLYKRKNDQEWRESVNARLVTLTSSESVQNDQLDDHLQKLRDYDEILRGNPKEKEGGLCGNSIDHERRLAKIEEALFRDSQGRGGLLVEMADLHESRAERRQGRADRRQTQHDVLQLITAIAVAAITSGVLTKNWSEIKHFLAKRPAVVNPVIEKSNHPRHGKQKRQRIKPAGIEGFGRLESIGQLCVHQDLV